MNLSTLSVPKTYIPTGGRKCRCTCMTQCWRYACRCLSNLRLLLLQPHLCRQHQHCAAPSLKCDFCELPFAPCSRLAHQEHTPAPLMMSTLNQFYIRPGHSNDGNEGNEGNEGDEGTDGIGVQPTSLRSNLRSYNSANDISFDTNYIGRQACLSHFYLRMRKEIGTELLDDGHCMLQTPNCLLYTSPSPRD